MQAYDDGKQVEFNAGNGWCIKSGSLNFNWTYCDYRVKPQEPKVIYVNEYEDGIRYPYFSKKEAIVSSGYGIKRTAVKYQEVIENDE